VGGGDQLYNDDVLQSPGLAPFTGATDEERCAMVFDEDMKFDVRGLWGARGGGAVAPHLG
jgi:hypothetical protein